MGRDLPYIIIFLFYFIFVSSNPVRDSHEDVLSQGFERERDGIKNHESVAERVSKLLFPLKKLI